MGKVVRQGLVWLTTIFGLGWAAPALSSADLPLVFQAVPQFGAPFWGFAGYYLSYGRRATPPLAQDGIEHRWFLGFYPVKNFSIAGDLRLATLERLEGRAWRVGAEVRHVVLERREADFDFSVSAGYAREVGRAHVAHMSAMASGGIGNVELASSIYLEKAFAAGRDSVDVVFGVGAYYPLGETFTVGVEYLGQDLEDLWEREEAEGGARHLLGPTFLLRAFSERVSLGVGVAAGLTKASPDLAARIGFVGSF